MLQVLVVLSLSWFAAGWAVATEEGNEAEESEELQPAVWKMKEVGFAYRSSLAVYSCRALQQRVASILSAIGARDDLDVRPTGCDMVVVSPEDTLSSSRITATSRGVLDRRNGPKQFVDVRIRVMMPTELTPEVVAEIDRDKSRRELISRVTGDPAASLNDPLVFPAKWQSVTLSRKLIGIGPQECELLEQMSASVFRELGVRVVRRGHTCDRDRLSRISPKMTVEALIGTGHPFGTLKLPRIPAAGEQSEDEPSEPQAVEDKPSASSSTVPSQAEETDTDNPK